MMEENNNNNISYEKEILNFWEKNNIIEKIINKNKNGEIFSFIDGPPYPTGEAHLGHMRNWAIKDTVLRFKRSLGYNVYARDGYDVHGLPVENKVQSKLKLNTVDELKKFGEENFVQECKTYVNSIIGDMENLRTRYGLLLDRNCYRTDSSEYISMAWQFFKKAEEKKLLYKDYKTVAWCPHDETTLSDYEIKDTYTTLEDPSIYVKFKLKKEFKKSEKEESLLIWTTTPWTLQSNMAIAVNPLINYARALIEINGKEEILIMAESLVNALIAKLSKQNNIKLIKIIETLKGADLEGIKYEHIYLDETPSQKEFLKENHKHLHSVILADFVSLAEDEDIFDKLEKRGYKHSNSSNDSEINLEQKSIKKGKTEGSGLVHIAPGHGFDDYNVSKKYNIPIFCPVNEKGLFTEGKYKGLYFKDVDPIAIEYLKEKGFLIFNELKSHRYPCCWRCKTPIVYRAADQWWIKRSQIVNEIIKENSNIHWFPKSAKDSFNNLMETAGDWAISRQRYWGIPLPIFEDEDGNYEVFASKDELEKRIGYRLEDIHRDTLKKLKIINEKNGKEMKAVPFIADVWFDSGCAFFASHYGENLSFDEIIKKYFPLNWICEGEDQIRGWFSSLFNVSYVITGKSPYNQVLCYSFVMDKNGQKMSKSLGNGISGNESIEKFGADATRYYLLSKNLPYNKLNFDIEEISEVSSFFNTLENTIKFMNNYLGEHNLKDRTIQIENLNIEDFWILYKLNFTLKEFLINLEQYKINIAYKILEEFISKDLSKTYLKMIKDRTEERDDNLIKVFSSILEKLLISLSFAIPFKTEKLYQDLNIQNKKDSIFLNNFPSIDEFLINYAQKKKINENFEMALEIITSVLNAREKVKIGLRWPLSKIDLLGENLQENLKIYEKLIKQSSNILEINYDPQNVEINYIIKPNFLELKNSFENISEAIKIINLNKFYIAEDLKKGESLGIYEGLELDYSKHIIKEIELKHDLISSDFKGGTLILHTKQDEILLESGYLRELIRRVQLLRKELGLEKKDLINLSFEGSDIYFDNLIENWDSYICKKVGAKEILKKSFTNSNDSEFEIKDKLLRVSIQKLQ